MPDAWGALAQIVPGAASLEDAYAVPAARRATVEIIMCNRGADAVVRASQAPAGAADDPAQYLLYEVDLAAGQSKATAKITLGPEDVIRVRASTADVAFHVNGIEEDA